MKLKILILSAGLAVLASCGPSYRVTDHSATGVNVPSSIQASFTAQYPSASDVSWSLYDAANLPVDWDLTGWPELNQSDYVATFNMDNNHYYAWYDENGNWIASTYAITDYASLPSPITSMINDKFPGYTIVSVNSEMQKNRMAYEIQLKKDDSRAKLLVDANGNVIKQKTITK